MTFKQLTGKLHLWLGLASGLIVFIISITGCILAFEKEITELTEPYQFSEPVSKPILSPSRLIAAVAAHFPENRVNSLNYPGGNYSVVAYSYGKGEYFRAFVDPYTGKVLKVKDMNKDFFRFILDGHFNLWMPRNIGSPIIASATLIFVILLISGLILWWPKNKSAAKQRFSFKWKETTKWKRRNYDLHNILGFYSLILALILAFTGLVWGFKWFSESLYWVTSGGKALPEYNSPKSDTTLFKANTSLLHIDRLWKEMSTSHPEAAVSVYFPQEKADALGIELNYVQGTYYKRDVFYFDQFTGKPLPDGNSPYNIKYNKASFADKLRKMNYDIHVGAILGFPGKMLAFIISLVCASLPVTGFYIWWGRNKKKKKGPKKIKQKSLKLQPA